MNAYSLYDSGSDSYGNPFFCLSDAEAIRGVKLGLRGGKTTFSQFPNDYRLCAIGSFNPASGSLVSHPKIRTVSELIALVEVPTNE